MDAMSDEAGGTRAWRSRVFRVGAVCGVVCFGLGVMTGLWASRSAIADECESTGQVSTGDRIFRCTDGRPVLPSWR